MSRYYIQSAWGIVTLSKAMGRNPARFRPDASLVVPAGGFGVQQVHNTTISPSVNPFGLSPEQLAACFASDELRREHLGAALPLPTSDDSARLLAPSAVSQADRLGLADPLPAPIQRVPPAPRSSNTGAQSADKAQTALVAVSADDPMPWRYDGFLIDWVRFVVVSPSEQVKALAAWRSVPEDWSEMDSGHMGYRRCYRLGGVAIYYDHAEEGRGLCFDISGKGCRQLEEKALSSPGGLRSLGWLGLLRSLTETTGVHLTRLDVAIDDRAGLVDLDVVDTAIEERRVVSRFKSAYVIEKKSLSTGKGYGKTANFGSRVSDVMVRMYNKAAEQKQESSSHWTRVEVEAKDESAEQLAKLMVSSVDGPGVVVAGVLRNYITFRDFGTNKQRCRWPVCAWWDAFLGGVEKMRLAVAKQEPLLIRMRGWLDRQVLPTLAVLYQHANVLDPGKGGKRLLADLVLEGERRLRPRHKEALRAELQRLSVSCPAYGPTGF